MNEHQIKDRIKQLEFEIDRLKKRKSECGTDFNCIAKVEDEIKAREDEMRDLKFSIHSKDDEKIDTDNNDYRERIYGEGDE